MGKVHRLILLSVLLHVLLANTSGFSYSQEAVRFRRNVTIDRHTSGDELDVLLRNPILKSVTLHGRALDRDLVDRIPHAASQIEHIMLKGTTANKDTVDLLCELGSLRVVEFEQCNIEVDDLGCLSRLPLDTLSFRDTSMRGQDTRWLERLNSLRSLEWDSKMPRISLPPPKLNSLIYRDNGSSPLRLEPQQWSSLEQLCLIGAKITERECAQLNSLGHLSKLRLVRAKIDLAKGEFYNLRWLELTNCESSAQFLNKASFPSLELLSVRMCKLGVGLSGPGGSKSLSSVIFEDCELSKSDLSDISSTVESLSIVGDTLSVDHCEAIAQFPRLETIYCEDCSLDDERLLLLLASPRLEILEIPHNSVSDSGCEALARHKSLTMLDLSRNPVGPQGVAHIARSPALKKASFSSPRISLDDIETARETRKQAGLPLLEIELE